MKTIKFVIALLVLNTTAVEAAIPPEQSTAIRTCLAGLRVTDDYTSNSTLSVPDGRGMGLLIKDNQVISYPRPDLPAGRLAYNILPQGVIVSRDGKRVPNDGIAGFIRVFSPRQVSGATLDNGADRVASAIGKLEVNTKRDLGRDLWWAFIRASKNFDYSETRKDGVEDEVEKYFTNQPADLLKVPESMRPHVVAFKQSRLFAEKIAPVRRNLETCTQLNNADLTKRVRDLLAELPAPRTSGLIDYGSM